MFFHLEKLASQRCVECENSFGFCNKMSVLGETHFGLSEFRTGLFSNGVSSGGSLHVPYGSGLGYNSLGGLSIPSVPLWRPTPFQAIPQYCMDIGCPCNLSRSYGSNFLDYVPSLLPPWYIKLAGELQIFIILKFFMQF